MLAQVPQELPEAPSWIHTISRSPQHQLQETPSESSEADSSEASTNEEEEEEEEEGWESG